MAVSITLISNALGTVLYAILGVALLLNWKAGRISALLVFACLVSAGWFGLQLAYYLGAPLLSLQIVQLAGVVRDAAWFSCLLAILGAAGSAAGRKPRLFGPPLYVAVLCLVQAGLVLNPGLARRLEEILQFGGSIVFIGFLILAIVGLVLVEQLFRNTRTEQRWMIKLFCLGVGGLFAYDIFLFSHAVLFNTIVPDLWNVRGAINALSVPLIALSVARNPQWKADLFVSRQVIFHSTAVLGVGGYLLLMAGVGYYIREFGGSWGTALEALFFCAAIMMLVVIMSSTQVRARAKVFLVKHFYKNKYEYREEWLNFTRTLAESEGRRGELEQLIVRAVACILDSRWGILWMRHESNFFVPVSEWQCGSLPKESEEPMNSPFTRFLEQRGWIVELDEVTRDLDAYQGLVIPDWLQRMNNAWLVVPLQQKDRLLGFMVLARSLAKRQIDWEDRDLLKTVAQQASGYLALLRLTEALAQARQFEAYNRLSAFLVHDLKNLAAQLSLVVANAERYRQNADFVDDAFATVANAVAKMRRMLATLKAEQLAASNSERVDLVRLLEAVVEERKMGQPAPTLEAGGVTAMVSGDRALLFKAVAHLVQNAQEATGEEGYVHIKLAVEEQRAVIEIEDNGCGMDQIFIRDHLFRPFDTTKGNAGMGIGVFEAHQIVIGAGGEITVASTPGKGTTFALRLPLSKLTEGDEIELQAVGDGA